MATLLTAAQLIRHAPAPVAEGYVLARLGREGGLIHATAGGLDTGAILNRLAPG